MEGLDLAQRSEVGVNAAACMDSGITIHGSFGNLFN